MLITIGKQTSIPDAEDNRRTTKEQLCIACHSLAVLKLDKFIFGSQMSHTLRSSSFCTAFVL